MFEHIIASQVDARVAEEEKKVQERFVAMGDRAFDGLSGDAMTVRFDNVDEPDPFRCGPIHYNFEQPTDFEPRSTRQEDSKRPFLASFRARAAGFLALFGANNEQPATPPAPLRISYRD